MPVLMLIKNAKTKWFCVKKQAKIEMESPYKFPIFVFLIFVDTYGKNIE